MCAAATGTTAPDGWGGRRYTVVLLAHLEQPPGPSALFRRVRAQVLGATDGEQRPHEYASLVREHYLSEIPGTAAPVAASGAMVDGATAANVPGDGHRSGGDVRRGYGSGRPCI